MGQVWDIIHRINKVVLGTGDLAQAKETEREDAPAKKPDFEIDATDAGIAEFVDHVPLAAPLNRVQVDVTPAQLRAIWQRIAASWEALGASSPHHSVLTLKEFLPDAFTENEDTFWQTGYVSAERAMSIFRKYSDADFKSSVISELGCGVGRITVPFSEHFKSVNALDISAPHLALAAEQAQARDASNIKFIHVEAFKKNLIPKCDFFYSLIVLQHNPPPVIAMILRSVFAALREGGLAVFQVPVYKMNYQFDAEQYLNEDPINNMEMHAIPLRVVLDLIEESGCRLRDLREDNAPGAAHEFVSNTFVVERPRAL